MIRASAAKEKLWMRYTNVNTIYSKLVWKNPFLSINTIPSKLFMWLFENNIEKRFVSLILFSLFAFKSDGLLGWGFHISSYASMYLWTTYTNWMSQRTRVQDKVCDIMSLSISMSISNSFCWFLYLLLKFRIAQLV